MMPATNTVAASASVRMGKFRFMRALEWGDLSPL
jgi:hypothetical protein